MWRPFVCSNSMTRAEGVEIISSSRPARLGAGCVVIALATSGLILKLLPGSTAGSFVSRVSIVMAILAVLVGAFYTIYLAVGAIRAGQFPAPHAHVPAKCHVARGWHAKIFSGLLFCCGILLMAFAALIASLIAA